MVIARTWRLPAAPSAYNDCPLASTVQQRGLCLMIIEFLTQLPAAECVVTCASLPFWSTVFDLFPKTLFQVFCSPLEDPPRPNVICHDAPFDSQMAARFGARGAPYHLLFTVEDMDSQLSLYLHAKPAAALMLIKRVQEEYLDGDLVFPLHCSALSGFCGLVPSPGQAKVVPYAGYCAAMLEFHATARRAGANHDRQVEDAILSAYARSISGLGDPGMAGLLVEMTRNDLPPLQASDVVLWEPPLQALEHVLREPQRDEQAVAASDIEKLLMAVLAAGASS